MKFKDIQIKIKLIYLRLFGKINKVKSPIKINRKDNKIIKNILIIFPVKEVSFRVAIYTFRNLSKDTNVNYYFIVNTIYKHHFHLPGSIFDLYYNVKKQKIKIDETFYEDRIINKKFDMIVDLNNEFYYDISSLINILEGYYKVGFKNRYSDYFYNIQINLTKTDILENGYNKIQRMLN